MADIFDNRPIKSLGIELRATPNFGKSMHDRGTHNGYVILPKGHKYYRIDYSDIPVDVHGGLTYGRMEGDNYVVGFDTCHLDDNEYKWNEETVKEETLRLQKQLDDN